MNTYVVDLRGTWTREVSILAGLDLREVLADIQRRMQHDLAAETVRIWPTDARYSIDGGWRDPRFPEVDGQFEITGMRYHADSMEEAIKAAQSRVRNWLDQKTCGAPELVFEGERGSTFVEVPHREETANAPQS